MKDHICEPCGYPAQHLRPTRRLDGVVVRACEDCALDLECERAHATGTYCPKHGAPVAAEQKGAA